MASTLTTVITESTVTITELPKQPETLATLKARISASKYTPFQKAVWFATLQIPPGCVSTYNLVAIHLRSSPRAVGNALRRNPFAPGVPCHRVVATNATIGGFKGKVARRDGDGLTVAEKRTSLRKEGIRFDGMGRVLGTPFSGFVRVVGE